MLARWMRPVSQGEERSGSNLGSENESPWIYDPIERDRYKRDVPPTSCCWITGIAGVGKTAIAITIIQCLLDSRTMVANREKRREWVEGECPVVACHYFFNHSLDSADAKLLFPTLALQMAQVSSDAAKAIHASLLQTPTSATELDFDQAHSLFLEPLRAIASSLFPRIVVVILDGLDELQPVLQMTASESYTKLTVILARVAAELPLNARLLILSRPQIEFLEHIPSHITRFHLDTQQSHRDVRRYFEAELPQISKRMRNENFPTVRQLELLCQAADGHLGWATQARLWLSSRLRIRSGIDIDTHIEALTKLAHGSLNALYQQVLSSLLSLYQNDRKFYLAGLRSVLGCLAVLRDQQKISTVALLVDAPDFNVQACLEDLSGIYMDGTQCLDSNTVFNPHKSFYDFLLSSETPPDFRVNPRRAHRKLAAVCFQIMDSDELHFNMGNFAVLSPSRQEKYAALRRIGEHVHYACESFIFHIKESRAAFTEELERWIRNKFLYWLEVSIQDEVSIQYEYGVGTFSIILTRLESLEAAYAGVSDQPPSCD